MPTYTPLQSIVLTSSASTVTFSNIPQIYQDLVVVSQGQITTGVQNMLLRVNGDTGSNYSYTLLTGNGSSAASARGTSTSNGVADSNGYLNATNFNLATLHFMNYSNTTTYKTILSRSNSASTGTDAIANLWRSTAAITSISVYPANSASFAAGSTFDLYGISPVAAQNAQAAGGTDIYYDSTYVYHVFKGSGTFTPYRSLSADVLVVAGGGGGAAAGGGGGAGGLLGYTSQSLTSGTSYTVTVGAGGTIPYQDKGGNGSNSQFSSLTASVGGGGGGSDYINTSAGENGNNGGSGGGGSSNPTNGGGNGGTGTVGQGNNGGASNIAPTNPAYGGGGGGGAGAVGANNTSTSGGAGGVGSSAYSSWGAATNTGQLVSSTYYYAGGGGGACINTGNTPGAGGSGGGGAGGGIATIQPGTSGTTNTGGGGGGGSGGAAGGYGSSGGSGIVIVRYAR